MRRAIISTHTPLAGRDVLRSCGEVVGGHFYSHAPRGARHDCFLTDVRPTNISTHTPLAGRDGKITYAQYQDWHFYSHAPRGARHGQYQNVLLSDDFYSHAPRGARRLFFWESETSIAISTHTPLAGRDWVFVCAAGSNEDFYSHAPRGARRNAMNSIMAGLIFLLTRPSRGATIDKANTALEEMISTHTPLAGRDE